MEVAILEPLELPPLYPVLCLPVQPVVERTGGTTSPLGDGVAVADLGVEEEEGPGEEWEEQ